MSTDHSPDVRIWAWTAVLAIASLALSRAFACAMPFAALAALAAFIPRRQAAIALVAAAWGGNQAIGFLVMHYPTNATTFGWGAAIGVAALTAFAGATILTRHRRPTAMLMTGTLGLAFAIYEGVLLAATLVLPSGSDAFAPATVVRILAINVVAFALLLAADRLAGSIGLVRLVRQRELALRA